MTKNLGVLFVASEADPFIRTGSLADLAGNIPKAIKNSGHDVRVVLPGYSCINGRRFQIHNLLRMKDICVPVAGITEYAQVRSSYLNGDTQKVLVYFLANDRYFNREGLYANPETKKYFPDNDERFIFFCRGVLEILKRLRWQPEVIHCNDWQTGLIPAYLKTIYKNDPFFRNVKTVFTVHNLASHGTFPKSAFEKSGLPLGLFSDNGGPGGRLNFLKAGMTCADVVTTIGAKAEKGIRHSSQVDIEQLFQDRKSSIITLVSDHTRANHVDNLARQFMDIYASLVKNG
ncbi:MAG TPA: glycogen/starch synthase [Bacteroidota bacterium]|nr:glycogen/starch synthase [Bacteroidota bacterium]